MKRPMRVVQASPGNPWRQSAFTLIELLVVIAVLGILSSMLLPALARTKTQAQGSFCLNNTRQLILACQMYCDDNKGIFPYNLAGTAVHTNINWVSDLLDWETNSDNTNAALLTGAALGPYVAQSCGTYRCPSDTALSAIQRSAGWPNRARSYSMNASIGDAGEITQSGVNINNPDYVQFFKLDAIAQTAQIFIFVEEHPDTISDGYFLNKAYYNEWIRLPASYHDGGATFSFADGHGELHHWQDASTKAPAQPDAAPVYLNLPYGEQNDLKWIITHMSVESN